MDMATHTSAQARALCTVSSFYGQDNDDVATWEKEIVLQ
jgi:hypothetical protein